MSEPKDIRWKQRFQNFEKAYFLLNEVMEKGTDRLSELEKEGVVQRFEIVIELSWKTLKDYLENEGYDQVKNAKQAIRQGFQDGIITDAESWMDALEKRNLSSHTYNKNILNEMMIFIKDIFYPIVRDLYFQLKKER